MCIFNAAKNSLGELPSRKGRTIKSEWKVTDDFPIFEAFEILGAGRELLPEIATFVIVFSFRFTF